MELFLRAIVTEEEMSIYSGFNRKKWVKKEGHRPLVQEAGKRRRHRTGALQQGLFIDGRGAEPARALSYLVDK